MGRQVRLVPPAPSPAPPARVEIIDEKHGEVIRISKAAVANYHASLLRILWKASTIEEATEIAQRAREYGQRR